MPHPSFAIRPYLPTDSEGWLRCRVLSFLHTQYYDDVKPSRSVLAEPAIALVATAAVDHIGQHNDLDRDTVIGILDIEIDGDAAATIDTIAIHPDHQTKGIGTALLQQALPLLTDRGVATLDAWTREDGPANSWYLKNGFTENFRYLHVYLGDGDDPTGFVTPEGCSLPVTAFVHAPIDREAEVRERFRRVYVCRQYLQKVILR
ncbi:MAG: GNAT family N-acetyltransferase [Actinomycetota bacterium]|nr:GNAT family N-acetyltransferase [Actinomycetota bacterium]